VIKRLASRFLVFLSVSPLGFLPLISSAQAATFNFIYSLPPVGQNGMSVSASGTFTTSAFNGTEFLITGMTGFRNGEPITGLLPPDSFPPNSNLSNDNFLFPSSPFLDVNGVSFTVAGMGNDGAGNVNLFFNTGCQNPNISQCYTEDSLDVGDGTFSVTAVTNPVPEPSTIAVVAASLLALVYLVSRGRPSTRSF